MFQRWIDTSAYVQALAIHDSIYVLSDNQIQAFNPAGEKVAENPLFAKAGAARSLLADRGHLYCRDFIHLYVLDKGTLEVVARLQLGTDLSSDICGMAVDDSYLYASIRNGAIARIEKGRWEEVQSYPLSDSSMWALQPEGGRIYAGTVGGQLLRIDAGSMQVERAVHAHKGNLKGLCILDHAVATASQDKSLALWDKRTCERVGVRKKVHNYAFSILGAWEGDILTVCIPAGEIKVWDGATLEERAAVPIPKGGSGRAYLYGSTLYHCAQFIPGINRADLAAVVAPSRAGVT